MSDLLQELESFQPTCRRGEGFADNITVDDGVIHGRAVPYGRVVDIGPFLERFEPGAFSRQVKDPSRVRICLEHGQAVGRITALEEREDGLYFTGAIPDEPAIPETAKARAMIFHGLADELSVGFQTVNGGTVPSREAGRTLHTHRRARLMEISLVPWGAYGRGATLQRAALVDPHDLTLELAREKGRQVAAEWAARVASWRATSQPGTGTASRA